MVMTPLASLERDNWLYWSQLVGMSHPLKLHLTSQGWVTLTWLGSLSPPEAMTVLLHQSAQEAVLSSSFSSYKF